MDISLQAAKGHYGTAGLYSVATQLFLYYGVLSFPILFFLDAPFGRFSKNTKLDVNGDLAWFIFESVSPLAFVVGLCTSPSSTPIKWHLPPLETVPSTVYHFFTTLPPARILLAGLFLAHYTNRALISTLRNPGRSRMSILVPLAAVVFNAINGATLGVYIGGGAQGATGPSEWSWTTKAWGLRPHGTPIFVLGCTVFLLGLAGNIVSDEILYDLRRHPPSGSEASPDKRYHVPHGFLYSRPLGGISFPSYLCEWLEFAGFVVATRALQDAPFPALALAHATKRRWLIKSLVGATSGPSASLQGLPPVVWPFKGWALQPPALFLWNEIAVMLPRAVSGHRWYKNTFRDRFPKNRKAVIPGLL